MDRSLTRLITTSVAALVAASGMCSCSTFLSRGPENAGGAIAEPGPFVGSRFAYNTLYNRPDADEPNLPQKIISPVILVADGGASGIIDVVMLPFDWNGSTVPEGKSRASKPIPTTEEAARQRAESIAR